VIIIPDVPCFLFGGVLYVFRLVVVVVVVVVVVACCLLLLLLVVVVLFLCSTPFFPSVLASPLAFAFGRSGMALTFQKEVAERIVAQPGCKDYNRLSIMVQHCCQASIIFDIGTR
jgi:hypothetical protein